jgi:hypothetical protein
LGARGRWFKSSHLDKLAVVAQLVEQLTCNEQVTGSNPVNGSNFMDIQIIDNILEESFCDHLIHKYSEAKPDFTNQNTWDDYIVKNSTEVLCNYLTPVEVDVVKNSIQSMCEFSNIDYLIFHRWKYQAYIPVHSDEYHTQGATIYLNKDWEPNDGGFFMYEDNNEWHSITPLYRRVVLIDRKIKHLTTPNTNSDNYRLSLQIWNDSK